MRARWALHIRTIRRQPQLLLARSRRTEASTTTSHHNVVRWSRDAAQFSTSTARGDTGAKTDAKQRDTNEDGDNSSAPPIVRKIQHYRPAPPVKRSIYAEVVRERKNAPEGPTVTQWLEYKPAAFKPASEDEASTLPIRRLRARPTRDVGIREDGITSPAQQLDKEESDWANCTNYPLTNLPPSRIITEPLCVLPPHTFKKETLGTNLPTLFRNPIRADPSPSARHLDLLATSTGLPAMGKWFSPPTEANNSPLSPYLDQFAEASLPYELLLPALPVIDVHNPNRIKLKEASAYESFIPKSPPLSDLLIRCLNHALSIGDSTAPAIKRTFQSLKEHLNSSDEDLRDKIRKVLRGQECKIVNKYGRLFQEFNAFDAPLGLMLKAQTSHNGTRHKPLQGLYIAQASLADLPAEMAADLPLPNVLANLNAAPPTPESPSSTTENEVQERPKRAGADIYATSLWLGIPPTFTPLHRDPNPNLFVQLHGEKIVRLLPPTQGGALYRKIQSSYVSFSPSSSISGGAIRGEEMMQGAEREALGEAVWGKEWVEVEKDKAFGGVGEEGGRTIRLGPGDALFVPKGWWHSVRSLGSDVNASVNWWFR